MKAILLAGGKGTRLRPLTLHTPKPIVPIFNRPFLHYQIDLLKQVPEIDEVILSLNYQPRRIEDVFGDGTDVGHQDPLRRGAGAARHRRRHPVRRRVADRVGRRVQRRRADADRSGRGAAAAPRAQGQGHDRADAGRRTRPPTGWSRPTPTATSGGSSRSRSPTRSPATRSTPASTSSSPTPSTGFRRTPPGRSSAASSPRSSSAARRSSPTPTAATGSTSARPEKYTQVHRDIMDGRYAGAAVRGRAPGRVLMRRDARVEEGAVIEGPCSSTRGWS